MHWGVTGTRNGWTLYQRTAFQHFVRLHFADGDSFHHGCCVGVDACAHRLVQASGYQIHIIGHPPTYKGLVDREAMRNCDARRPALPFLKRNERIVSEIRQLIVVPSGFTEIKRGSGTWATYRYAKRHKRITHILLPDGRIEREDHR